MHLVEKRRSSPWCWNPEGVMPRALLIISLICAVGVYGVHSQDLPLDGSQASAALSFNPASDPLGDVDTYKFLQKADVEGQWSKDDGRNATEKMEELLSFNSVLHVDVKLVGFDGEGNYGIKVDEADFLRYFETVLEEHEKEAMVMNARRDESHRLPVSRKFFFRVMKVRKGFSDDISQKIKAWVVEGKKASMNNQRDADAEDAGYSVPVSIVDDLIKKDYVSSEISQTHTIYLLNPRRVMMSDVTGRVEKEREEIKKPVFKEGEPGQSDDEEDKVLKYWYSTSEQNEKSSGFACGTTMWAGSERYMWIDLTAGPISYGPHTSGDGLVSEFSIPHLDNFQVDGVKDPSQKHPYAFVQEYLAEVVALVGKTCDHLMEPSLHHFPVPLVKNLKLHLVHVTNNPSVSSQHADQYGYMQGMPRCEAWETIKTQLGEKGRRIALVGQSITYNRSVVQLNECKYCLAAYAASLRSHTSTVLRGQLKTQVHEYIDSKELHEQVLTFLNKEELQFAEELGIHSWRNNRRPADTNAYKEEWTIPVFVFDMEDKSLVLLDRFSQAVSYPEMVLALQTKSGPAALDFSCTDEMMTMDPGDASRPTLAALLQTGWGVVSTHEHFSGKTNKTEISYLWSTTSTPFGPFSQSASLNFALLDAAKRNIVYSALNESISQVSGIMEQFSKFGKHIEDVLLPGEHQHFVRRWNVLKFKMSRTSTYLSLLNFNTALFYARSMRHDVNAIRLAVLRAGQFMHSYVGCLHDKKPSILRFLVYLFGGTALLIMMYVLIHTILARKRKNTFKKKL